MTSRAVRLAILLLGSAASLSKSGAALGGGGERAESWHPHIVFILADDLGYHDLGFKYSGINTPIISRLASQGRLLKNYYVQPSCAPTRATIMSGRHMTSHGVTFAFNNGAPRGLSESEILLPEVLAAAGYSTHAVGKWHLGFYRSSLTPTFRGFESFYGFYGESENYVEHTHEDAYDFRLDVGFRCGLDCSIVDESAKGKYSTILFTERAVEVITDHNASRPLFLYLSWQAVHAPVSFCPSGARNLNKLSQRDQTFACTLTLADQGLGQIMTALDEKDMLSSTIIVFSSDNGGATSTSVLNDDDVGSSNYPLRGGKHTLFEGGVRVDGFVWAGWWMLGELAESYAGIMGSVDWFPTLLEAARIASRPASLEGINQWDSIAKGRESPRQELFISAAQYGQSGRLSFAYRWQQWKLILGVPCAHSQPWGWSNPNGSQLVAEAMPFLGETLLFNVEDDPSERINQAHARSDIVRMITIMLEKHTSQNDRLFHRPDPNYFAGPGAGGVWGPWE